MAQVPSTLRRSSSQAGTSWAARVRGVGVSWAMLLRFHVLWWWSRYLRAPALAALFGLALALAFGEVVLRALPPGAVPTGVSNIMFTCYEPKFPERYIYANATAIEQPVHQPNLRAECYFNGYTWQHQSDGYGWRNPETWDQADVVLLGDSMIYGHGVEEHQTVAHFLREDLGVRVANHAMMGNCPIDYLGIYRNFSLPLRPKVTVMTVYANDLDDLQGWRPDVLDRFAATGELPQAGRYRRADLLSALSYPEVSAPQRWAGRSRIYSLLRYYVPALQAAAPWREAPGIVRPLPGPDPALALAGTDYRGDPDHWYGRELGFTRRVIATMAASARAQDSLLVVGYLPALGDDYVQQDVRLPMYLARFAAEAGALYYWAGAPTANAAGTRWLEGTRLPIDGHLSERGHRLLAEDLARFLRRHVPALAR